MSLHLVGNLLWQCSLMLFLVFRLSRSLPSGFFSFTYLEGKTTWSGYMTLTRRLSTLERYCIREEHASTWLPLAGNAVADNLKL